MNLQRISSAVVAVACAASLTACGADTGATTATLTKASFASRVAAATADVTSVHVRATVSVRGMVFNVQGDLAVNGKTVQDLVARFHVQSMLPRGSATLLLTDGAAYLKTVGFPLPSKSGKPWLKADLTDPSNPVAAMYDKVMSHLNPATIAKAFRATTQLRQIGVARVAGVETTHYAVAVDTAKVMRLLGMPHDAGADHPEARSLPKTLHFDVWLDSAQRPVRVKGASAGVALDLTFTSWGERVSVQAPPASQVSKVSF